MRALQLLVLAEKVSTYNCVHKNTTATYRTHLISPYNLVLSNNNSLELEFHLFRSHQFTDFRTRTYIIFSIEKFGIFWELRFIFRVIFVIFLFQLLFALGINTSEDGVHDSSGFCSGLSKNVERHVTK